MTIQYNDSDLQKFFSGFKDQLLECPGEADTYTLTEGDFSVSVGICAYIGEVDIDISHGRNHVFGVTLKDIHSISAEDHALVFHSGDGRKDYALKKQGKISFTKVRAIG